MTIEESKQKIDQLIEQYLPEIDDESNKEFLKEFGLVVGRMLSNKDEDEKITYNDYEAVLKDKWMKLFGTFRTQEKMKVNSIINKIIENLPFEDKAKKEVKDDMAAILKQKLKLSPTEKQSTRKDALVGSYRQTQPQQTQTTPRSKATPPIPPPKPSKFKPGGGQEE
ncbi:MAG: hypothetical protein ACHQJ6_05120 [Candidatus Berkiellales bacterium]